MKCHTVKLSLSAASRGKVWIDGQEVPRVRRVRISAGVEEATSVELELVAVDIECEVMPELPPLLPEESEQ